MISKNFYESLELIAQERNLEIVDIADKVAIAMKKACQLEGIKGDIEVDFNYEKKEIRVYSILTVVAEIDPEGPEGQILLPEAKLIKERVRVGSTIRRKVDFEKEVGRKGAAQFKQLFTQGLKELGRKRAYEFFKDIGIPRGWTSPTTISASLIGSIIDKALKLATTINKVLDEAVILGIGMDYDAYMPKTEALPTDTLIVGRQLKVYITKVEETGKGPKVFVSRTHRDIIKRLFEMYIPEVASGVIEIVALAREPGSRTKIAIKSNNINVDAKGACVGLNGARIKQINNALNGERIDIFEWKENPIQLISEALTPAKVISVLVNEEEKRSIVIVPDQQFSLAIGKGGQNARLASQTSGWKIDIKDETTAYREEIKFKPNVY